MSNVANTNKTENNVKEVNAMFKYVGKAYKTKSNKSFIFIIDGHKYILTKTTAEDMMYSGIRGDYKVVEIIEK